MSMSRKDAELLKMVGMTPGQAERNAVAAESETESDHLTGKVYWGLHFAPGGGEEMETISLRVPKSTLARVTADAKRYHLSRSEYIRRKLADA